MEQEKDDSQAAQIDDNDESNSEDDDKNDVEDDDEDNNDPLPKNAPRYIWKMREVNDCRTELAEFAIALQTTLTERSKSMPKLNELLRMFRLWETFWWCLW